LIIKSAEVIVKEGFVFLEKGLEIRLPQQLLGKGCPLNPLWLPIFSKISLPTANLPNF